MNATIAVLLVLGVIVLLAGLFAFDDSREQSLKVIKPAKRKIESRSPARNKSSVKVSHSSDDSSTARTGLDRTDKRPEFLDDMITPSDPFDRVTTDGETAQARDARLAAKNMADTDPAKLVLIIRKWRQEDEGRKFR